MPKRPRSHELEDISIARFQALCPPAWIIRQKTSDYGVDLEIEVFIDGEATGLMAFVQIRATDDPVRADRVVLALDQLAYLENLPAPALIVRYSAASDTFMWSWSFVVANSAPSDPQRKTFTWRYAEKDRWADATPAAIVRTLQTLRAIGRRIEGTLIGFNVDVDQLPIGRRYAARSAIVEAARDAGWVEDADLSLPLSLVFAVATDHLKVCLAGLPTLTMAADTADRRACRAATLYAAAAVLARHGIGSAARATADAALTLGVASTDRETATNAATALAQDPDRAVDLALLNHLHVTHDPAYLIFLLELVQARRSGRDVRHRSAVTRFLTAAVQAAEQESPETAGAVHYTAANQLRALDPLAAVAHYNKARRRRPAYLSSPYFLRELGSCMFGTRRYACAALLYERALGGDDTALDICHLGDAQLFAGRIEEAADQYSRSAETADKHSALISEALLKEATSRWLVDLIGRGAVTPLTLAAKVAHRGTTNEAAALAIISRMDATDETAHFNLAVLRSQQGRFTDALFGFLICAFKRSGDLEAWSNAAICCQHLADNGAALSNVLVTAISLGGSEAYDHLRTTLADQQASEEFLVALDEAFEIARRVVVANRNDGFTIRILDGRDDRTAGIQ